MAENPPPDGLTDFGFERVAPGEKTRRVTAVFESVAKKYDVMNDLMSLGLHRVWKRFAVELVGARPGHRILDLACGTGDLTALLSGAVGPRGEVVASDINASMIAEGRARLTDRGIVGNVSYARADAANLPFLSESFDAVTIAFGLRNVTYKDRALKEMRRVLKLGGKLVVLEFSKPVLPGLQPVYDAYSFKLLPLMGRLVAQDADSYRYLAESIRMHPDQPALKAMLEAAGFARVDFYNLAGGIVSVHRGFKL
jgi:demethylmenaquinone methyltransferase/2-methoxy-6-polyprenyl-1,4-benzoquinol methylase